MAILRNPNRNKFTVVDNYALHDENLSLKARGLLITILSFPDDWQFSENGLCALFKQDGQSSIRSGLQELEENGYLVRKKTRDDRGRILKVEWIICDYPHLENPNLDNSNLENQPQLNTKELNTKELKTNRVAQMRFAPPTFDEVNAYCRERRNQVNPQTFVDFYASKGWMVGKTKMKDWRAAVRTWEKRDTERMSANEPKRYREL